MDTKRIIADIDAEISKLQRILYDKFCTTKWAGQLGQGAVYADTGSLS
jgi:hypothetical protein